MDKFYVLTSDQVPERCWVTEEVNDENKRTIGLRISTDIPYTLTEVPAFGSLKRVPISKDLKFATFLKGDGELFSADEEFEMLGVVADIRKTSWLSYSLYTADGTIVADVDLDVDNQHKVLPPEMFGLDRYPWWEELFSES